MARKTGKKDAGKGDAPAEGREPSIASLLHSNRIVELRGADKRLALDQLVSCAARALDLSPSRQLDLSAAVQAREAALNTQLGPGWAAPHASLSGIGKLVLIVGRSKAGIDYGRPELGPVHVFFLFVSPPEKHDEYLRALSQLVPMFREAEKTGVIHQLLAADTPRKLKALFWKGPRSRRLVVSRRLPNITRSLIRHLLRFADDIDAEPIVLFADVFKDQTLLRSFVNRKIVLATRGVPIPETLAERARGVVNLARGDFSEESAVQLALLAAGARGFLSDSSQTVAVCGEKGSDTFDTIRIARPRTRIAHVYEQAGPDPVTPEVLERALQLAVDLAEQGREGRPLGTTMVLGDSEAVREFSQQLTINPFKGYEASERNLLDPTLEETVKEFASLDGAFLISGSGIIQSAGAYLSPPASVRVDLVSGLGTRHRVAAAITKATAAVAIVISQSTGRVTVFRGGEEILAVAPARGRVASPSPAAQG